MSQGGSIAPLREDADSVAYDRSILDALGFMELSRGDPYVILQTYCCRVATTMAIRQLSDIGGRR